METTAAHDDNWRDGTRRQFIAGVAALAAANQVRGSEAPRSPSPDGPSLLQAAFEGAHRPRPLPFDSSALRGLSKTLMESHWTNNYGGAVRTLNSVKLTLLAASTESTTPAHVYNGLKREHLLRAGSVVMHDLYFENLGGSGRVGAEVQALIAASFGSFGTWETEFRRIASGLAGGSGWVVLAYSPHFGTLENYWLADHLHFPAGCTPLLVLDMYEHAYQIDFGAAAGPYIDAAFANFDWDVVAARIKACRSAHA